MRCCWWSVTDRSGFCEAEARRLGLDAAVRFLGQRPDVADVLAATDMLALTSICEPFGYVVVDAAALAVPTVAFASGAVPEIVRHEVTGCSCRKTIPKGSPPPSSRCP